MKFSGRHFSKEIILTAIRWYLRYKLSYRDIEELMYELGIKIDHSTINRWVVKYVPLLVTKARPHKRSVGISWRLDETYIKAFHSAHATLQVVELIQMIRKGQVRPVPGGTNIEQFNSLAA
jgi:transposase-like protein